jgi:hypothetical protein
VYFMLVGKVLGIMISPYSKVIVYLGPTFPRVLATM